MQEENKASFIDSERNRLLKDKELAKLGDDKKEEELEALLTIIQMRRSMLNAVN